MRDSSVPTTRNVSYLRLKEPHALTLQPPLRGRLADLCPALRQPAVHDMPAPPAALRSAILLSPAIGRRHCAQMQGEIARVCIARWQTSGR
jgi:hypothetical protein